jgi:integrase
MKLCERGQTRIETLGHWPEINIFQARELAASLKNKLRQGGWAAHGAKSQPLHVLAREWHAKFSPAWDTKTAKNKWHLLRDYILPAVGRVKTAELTPQIVLNSVLRPIEESGRPEVLKKSKTVLSQLFRYGVARGVVERDFTADVQGAFVFARPKHLATITEPAKIGRLLSDIRRYDGSASVKFALRILPYIFTRPGELSHAEWTEINLEAGVWKIPAHKMKTRVQHIVPLATQTAELFRDLKTCGMDSRYAFPGQRTRDRPISDAAMGAALRSLGWAKEEICPHGFRAMASTLLNERGYNRDWIERQLAHNEQNEVRASYNHAQHLAERIGMMQEWADYLDSLAGRRLCSAGLIFGSYV